MTGLGRRTAALAAGAIVAAGVVVAPAQAADPPIVGPLTSGDSLYPNQGNGGYDVSHYDLEFTWNPGPPGGTIDATTTITATTTGSPLSSFGLDFEGEDLDVISVTVDDVSVLPDGITRINKADGHTAPGQHKLVIAPATPVEGEFTVVVHYAGNPHERGDETAGSDEGWIPTADGASFMNQPIGSMTGFPNNDTPKDKATYKVTVDVPAGLEVVSNGEPETIAPATVGGRQTWVWHETKQMASELATIGIGQFDVKEGMVTLSGGRTIPEYSFIESTTSTNNKTLFGTRRAQLSGILTELESFLGPYPGNSTGLIVDNTGVGYALETQDRPSFPSVGAVGGTMVHELTHQWYGDAVAPADWNGIWVNEGMATWAPVHADNNQDENEFFGEWNITPTNSTLWKTPPSGMTQPQQLFGWQSYDRGAMTYEALRAAIGDAAYFQLIKKWQVDFGGQAKGWTDLITLAEQLSGKDLTAFFQDWIYDADKPDWPGKLSLVLGATPGAGPVPAGSTLTYSLTATNTGKVDLTGAQVDVDLADVLDHAALGALPAGLSVAGSTLTWTVPTTQVGDLATTSFPVTVPATAEGASLSATASISTLGGTCATCTVTHTVGPPVAAPPSPATIGAGCQVDIHGKARVGRKLTATLSGCPAGAAATYAWFVGGRPISGATRATYKPKRSKLGKRISVRVAVSAPGFAAAERRSRQRKVRR